ncbi:uncharacterized protein LOC126701198 [Quercus robur]|uniref:uncharacterized protein LOC126701198 n=1 Tax=Quercus robur TaxID=38942 RepID=UPI0021612008|nr:uncharacterized protein LOC126701198 [Quercus robur]
MTVYFKDEALMCKVFPSSLGPMAMRWFDGLKPNSINSFKQLIQAFGSRFITSSKVPRPLDSLLSLSMQEGETLKAYSDRYWEMYNEIEGNYDDVAISTFKRGLPTEHGLRKSLIGKLVTSVRQLIDRIDKYKRVEEDQQTGKGKAKIVPQERWDFRLDRIINSNRSRRDYLEQSGFTGVQAVHAVFQEPLHKILEKVKHEPFFQWPSRMASDPSKCNQNLYCAYHREPGHTTDDCRNLKNHLDWLAREGKLMHLLHHPVGWQEQSNTETRQSTLRPPIDIINVILAAPGKTSSNPFRVMSVSRLPAKADDRESKKARAIATLLIGFSDEDKQGTFQPHDDALVVTLRIGGYDVKMVLVNQGSAVKVMYPDLYKELNLKPGDLSAYDSPLVSFEGKTVTPKADRCKPFFLLLNKWKGFKWTEECALAFQQLKEYLTRPPIMSSPEADEMLFAYIAVASHAVSLVLIREDNGTQRPIYYVSKSLHEAETRYLPLEKGVLAIVQAM